MNKESSKNISINFGLDFFEIKKYEYNKPKQEIDPEKLDYSIQFRNEADVEKGTISFEFKIIGQTGRESSLKLGYIQTLTSYRLSNIDALISNDGDIVLPKRLAISFLSIALSTTRGALVAKSENNIFSKEVLPLVDPKELYEASHLKEGIEL
jgi:hypothetical protein